MKFDLLYYISQFLVLVAYLFVALTYFTKDRKRILILGFFSLGSIGIAYVILSAYTGLAMIVVAAIRNALFLVYKKEKEQKKILIIVYILIIISTAFTYTGLPSLLATFTCSLYTYSIWQKDTRKYKILSIPGSLAWIVYNIYIYSIFTVICESVLIVSAIIGLTKDRRVKICHTLK